MYPNILSIGVSSGADIEKIRMMKVADDTCNIYAVYDLHCRFHWVLGFCIVCICGTITISMNSKLKYISIQVF